MFKLQEITFYNWNIPEWPELQVICIHVSLMSQYLSFNTATSFSEKMAYYCQWHISKAFFLVMFTQPVYIFIHNTECNVDFLGMPMNNVVENHSKLQQWTL